VRASPELALDVRDGLPDALRVLVHEYPRETWEPHAGFSGLVQFWMQRHMMFRQLIGILRDDAVRLGEKSMGFADYAPRLSHYAGTLLNELHGHHQIEDHHYFPQLVGLDTRVARGFDLLETDHEAMDALLNGVAEGANAVLQGGEIGPFGETLDRFGQLLERHLTDEEEIVVPVILHSGFRG
jgi:iron-sulfur cluster repair protein YtfE (RIC family)